MKSGAGQLGLLPALHHLGLSMKDAKAHKGIDQLNVQVSVLRLGELEHSHYILERIIASLPADTRREFTELLQVLAEGDKSQDLFCSAQEKVSQIVMNLCRQDQPDNKKPPNESERRAGDRRKQDRRQGAYNSHKAWTVEQIRILQILTEQNIPTRQIAKKLGRTSGAIESKAKELICSSVKPNRSVRRF
jgi:hypothetical protein